jgi:hypothetical protein
LPSSSIEVEFFSDGIDSHYFVNEIDVAQQFIFMTLGCGQVAGPDLQFFEEIASDLHKHCSADKAI